MNILDYTSLDELEYVAKQTGYLYRFDLTNGQVYKYGDLVLLCLMKY